jgi:hypothetical protein
MATIAHGPPGHYVEAEAASIPYDEAMDRFDGQWVLLQPVGQALDGRPAAVRVIAHSHDHDEVWRVLAGWLRERGKPDVPYHILEAAPCVSTGDGLRRALAELSDRDTVDDVEEHPGPGASRWR